MNINSKLCIHSTIAEKPVVWYLYNFIKSYLYLLASGSCVDPEVEVISINGISDMYSHRPKPLAVSDDLGGKYVRVSDSIINGLLKFHSELYLVTVFSELRHCEEIGYFVHILGESKNSCDAQLLLDHLLNKSVQTSPYQNETLLATSGRTNGQMIGLYDIDVGNDLLSEVFLPDEIHRQLNLFISALTNFDVTGVPLRYLFSGKPGTGKTKIIRAIANACKGKATFIFSNGAEEKVDELFEVASLFSPVVLCIDDIDMLTGSRQEGFYNRQLATFLQWLDGFTKGDQFLLATTNDKDLVDLAASRPGRFDRIIDVSLIEPEHYINLVKNKTMNETVIEKFDDNILDLLRRKRVSGAFITTLVKHLELIAKFDPMRLDKEYVASAIEGALEGFYEKNKDGKSALGFRAA